MATHPNPLRCITIVSPSPSPSSPSSSSATSHHRHHHYGNGSILNGGNEAGLSGLMRVIKIAPRGSSYGALFHAILVLAILLPFVFILAAVVTLEGVDSCSSFDCLGRQLGPKFLGRSRDNSERIVRDLYKIFEEVNPVEIPVGVKLPESFTEFISEMKNDQYDAKTFAI